MSKSMATPARSAVSLAAAAALLCFFAGCAGARRVPHAGEPEAGGFAAPVVVGEPSQEAERALSDARMAAALDLAAEGRWEDLRLECECRTEDSWAAAEIFGDGTAIWDNSTQFRLERDELSAILGDLRRLGFAGMPPSFGGRKEPDKFALRVICRVSLEIDGVSKEVVQFDKGEQSAELREIAGAVFKVCRERAEFGITPSGLGEALEKIAAGKLSGATLELTLNRKPGDADLRAGEPGYLLRIDGGQATVRPYLADGLGEARTLRLEPKELEELAAILSREGAADLPFNLYSKTYTDLTLRVLKWKTNVQARQFAKMTPTTHGDKQRQFDAIYERLSRIADQVSRLGTPSPSGD